MGVWGTALFSDDTASDIRGDYVDYLGDGLTGPEATARVLSEYKSSLSDPDEYGVVWLALAAVQWKYGRLEPDALKQALAVIDSGSDLRRWTADTPDHAKRKAVDENHDVWTAVRLVFDNGELVYREPVVGIKVVEVEQARAIAANGAVGARDFDGHAFNKVAM